MAAPAAAFTPRSLRALSGVRCGAGAAPPRAPGAVVCVRLPGLWAPVPPRQARHLRVSPAVEGARRPARKLQYRESPTAPSFLT